jgi:Dolichyl-phosphate-mannose-protein mannosyltransferase
MNDQAPRLATRVLLSLVLAKIALHLLAITRYGYFRDELYYLASTEHLSWGYVEHPPLSIAVLAIVRALLGDSLVALRLVPLLAGAATVFLTGVIARRLGGGTFAQGVAALAALLSPVFLGVNHYYSMNSLDLLLWTIAIWRLLVCLDRGRLVDWLGFGVVLGLGLLNKISMLWLCGGLGLGLLLTPHRRVLATPGPWVAAVIAGLLFTPHIVWQVRNDWPMLEFMHNATAHKMAETPPLHFLIEQILTMNPGAATLWLAGLAYALFTRDGRRFRVLACIYLAVFALLLAGGRSRASYLSVAYPMLLALGGLALERWTATRARWLRVVQVALIVLLGIVALPFALPILPVETFLRYQTAMGRTPSTDERQEMGPLPQQYADMFGWPEMTALVATAYARLTPEERTHVRVFGQNYGEAGAVDVLGRRDRLPRAMSGHNSYWLWGPGDWDGRTLIIIGGDRPDNAAFFDSLEVVGRVESRYSMPYERVEVSIGRGLRVPVRELWSKVKLYI